MTTKIEHFAGPQGNLMTASRQWASRPADQRFQTLEELAAAVNSRRSRSFHRDYDLNRLRVEEADGNDLRLIAGDRPLEFTNWSFKQLSSSVRAPASFLSRLPAELAARNLNECLKMTFDDENTRDGNKLLMIRPEDDPNLPLSAPTPPDTLQAVTSPSYGRIWDADCVALCQGIVRDHPEFRNPPSYGPDGKIVRAGLYASDHDCFMFLVDGGSRLETPTRSNGRQDGLHRGFFMWNSETMAATYGIECFLFNTVCGNHIVWQARDITRLTIRHSKGGPTRFQDEALPVLLDHVHASAAGDIEVIKAAQAYELPKDDADLIRLVSPAGITRGELRAGIDVAKREEGQCVTVWDLLQGLTAHAREMAYVDARVDLERRSGKLMEIAKGRAASAPVSVSIENNPLAAN